MKANRYLIALVAALGLIPIVLDTTIVTVALNPIRADLHTDVNTVQWIVTAFFLANAAVVAVGGTFCADSPLRGDGLRPAAEPHVSRRPGDGQFVGFFR